MTITMRTNRERFFKRKNILRFKEDSKKLSLIKLDPVCKKNNSLVEIDANILCINGENISRHS
ncbi:hypothetical protein LV84_00332 [Algoriphagus ratkowskyi]|uniref:Uncharacterized protein n=1 Tax=Algoriphagus ratkowskyi TaxID=57028 RepID=A0A2W7RLS9_9BACT|nr:hypothetical protein LV84_00332 [Algoriphagus ratkowskyi]